MTYQQLLEILSNLPTHVLEQTVTTYLDQTDEYVAVNSTSFTEENNDVLDEGHLIMHADI